MRLFLLDQSRFSDEITLALCGLGVEISNNLNLSRDGLINPGTIEAIKSSDAFALRADGTISESDGFCLGVAAAINLPILILAEGREPYDIIALPQVQYCSSVENLLFAVQQISRTALQQKRHLRKRPAPSRAQQRAASEFAAFNDWAVIDIAVFEHRVLELLRASSPNALAVSPETLDAIRRKAAKLGPTYKSALIILLYLDGSYERQQLAKRDFPRVIAINAVALAQDLKSETLSGAITKALGRQGRVMRSGPTLRAQLVTYIDAFD